MNAQLPPQSEEMLLAQFLHRRSLISFISAVAPWFRLEEIHHVVARYFELVEERKIDRLMLSMGPRGSKSSMSSIFMPSWWMGNHPTDQIMAVGYKMDLPRKFSRQVMGIMRSREYNAIFPGVQLSKDAHATNYWNVETIEGEFTRLREQNIFRRGEYQAAGVTSGIAGTGFNLGIVDDPLSEQDKDSKIAKDRVWEWWGPGFYTRRQPERNAIILIMTRWAIDDLAGRLLEAGRSGGDKWEVVNIPAILDGDSAKRIYTIAKNYPMLDPKTREPSAVPLKEGDSFCPRRISTKELLRSKANMPERDWQALYMGNPTVDEGQIIKRQWWRMWPHKNLPEIDEVITFYDTAFESHEAADFSAMTTWGFFWQKERDGRAMRNAILLRRWKRRVESPDLPKIVTALQVGTKVMFPKHEDEAEKVRIGLMCGYGPDEDVPAEKADSIQIEKKGSGINLVKELRRQKTPHIPVRGWTPPRGDAGKEKGKYARAMFAAWTFEAGSIWYPDKDWAYQVIDEVAKCRFDGTDESDDLADTVVMMATYVRQRYMVERTSDIDEEEEAAAAIRRPKKRGYGNT
jgi:hypothetical protein